MKELLTAVSLRIWHVPQIPGDGFRMRVATVEDAALVLEALANYDLFLLENNHRVDYANAQGLEVYVGDQPYETNDGWEEWENEFGMSIGEARIESQSTEASPSQSAPANRAGVL